MNNKIPDRYIPIGLSKKDYSKQRKNIIRSRKNYIKGKYINRPHLKSFIPKLSPHILRAKKLYNVSSMEPTPILAKASGCSQSTLHKIISKGQGAYYSSGSRPNQTAHSWGYARLGSSLTGGPSSQIDYNLLKLGCSKKSIALKYANKTRKNRTISK